MCIVAVMFTLFKKSPVVVAHNGDFHADDVFAVASISLLLGKIKVVRTRDGKIIEAADYVVDVGGTHDPLKNRFDHHQKGGAGKRDNGIPYAAFGLVWKTYGEKIAGSKEAAAIIDQKLVSPVDSMDNGVAISKDIFPDIRSYDLGAVIGSMNPNWNESKKNTDKIFLRAVRVAKGILQREIKSAKAALLSEKFVLDAYKKTADKRLIILDRDYDWERVIYKFPEPLFVVFPKDDVWRIKAVRASLNSFENRKDLPESWAGKRMTELAATTGVPDTIFCHNMRFVASVRSKEGALKLAQIALES